MTLDLLLTNVIIFETDILSHGGVSDFSSVKHEISKNSVAMVLVASMVIVVVGMTTRIPVRAYPSDSIFAQQINQTLVHRSTDFVDS